MADLSITAANVGLADSANVRTRLVQFGEAVTHCQPVYLNASDGKYYKDDADLSSENKGITLMSGSANGYGIIIEEGDFKPGATLSNGETYITSATAGNICPIGDLASGDYSKILFQAKSSSVGTVKRITASTAKA